MPLVLIGLAAFFKAVADTLDDHYDTSVFRKFPWQVWDANRSTQGFLPFTKYKFDPWHVCNSLLIVCFMIIPFFYKPHFKWYWELLIAGAVYNVIFGIFYSKILRRK